MKTRLITKICSLSRFRLSDFFFLAACSESNNRLQAEDGALMNPDRGFPTKRSFRNG